MVNWWWIDEEPAASQHHSPRGFRRAVPPRNCTRPFTPRRMGPVGRRVITMFRHVSLYILYNNIIYIWYMIWFNIWYIIYNMFFPWGTQKLHAAACHAEYNIYIYDIWYYIIFDIWYMIYDISVSLSLSPPLPSVCLPFHHFGRTWPGKCHQCEGPRRDARLMDHPWFHG